MQLLAPSALWLAVLLPALVLPYLLERRAERRAVSSLLGYAAIARRPAPRRIGLPRLTPLFFLQLVALALLVLAAAEPVRYTGAPHALVLDTSLRMQAGDGARFAAARERARTALARGATTLFVTTPTPHAVGVDAGAALDALFPSDAAGPAPEMLATFLDRLAGEYASVTLVGDYVVDDPRVTALGVGPPTANRGLVALGVHRTPFAPARVTIGGRIGNFGPAAAATVAITPAGEEATRLASLAFELPPFAETPFAVELADPPELLQIRLEPPDALPADDRAVLVVPPAVPLDATVVTPVPDAAASLRAVPNLRLRVLAPEAYAPTSDGGGGVTIFHLTAPTRAPAGPALLVMPPPDNTLVPTTAPSRTVTVATWATESPLTAYVNFRLIRPVLAAALATPGDWEVIAAGTPGTLVATHAGGRHRLAAVGFDLLPYLGRANLPVSILTLNLLAWLGAEASAAPLAAGSPLTLPPDAVAVITPGGIRLPASGPVFTATEHAGVYRVVRRPAAAAGDPTRPMETAHAVAALAAVDLSRPVRVPHATARAATPARRDARPLAPLLAAIVLALLLLEWLVLTRPPLRDA